MDLKNKAEYALYRVAIAGLGILPYPLAAYKLGLIGSVAGASPWFRRSVVEENLRSVYPKMSSAGVSKMRRNIYRHLARTVAETFFAPEAALMSAVKVDPGWDILDAAMDQGKGVILATAHLGNFELGGRILAGRYNLLDVIKPQRNSAVDQHLKAMRLKSGIQTVPMAQSIKPVLKHLQNQGLVSLLLDQNAGKNGVVVPFLGLPASTWPGAAHLSIRTGAPVVPAALVRDGKTGFVLHIGKPLDPTPWDDTPPAVAAYTAEICASVEKYISAYPEQWFWVHRRWKGASEAREIL